jgi:hypothetical protein
MIKLIPFFTQIPVFKHAKIHTTIKNTFAYKQTYKHIKIHSYIYTYICKGVKSCISLLWTKMCYVSNYGGQFYK